MRVGFLGTSLLLLVCGGCRNTCTGNNDCYSGEICAGPAQGPYECRKACAHDSDCAGDMACMPMDCVGCQYTVDVCFPRAPTLMSQ
jgi:hypothetical protein